MADLSAEVERLKTALGEIAALGDFCEECEVSGAPIATHVTTHPLTGIPIFLCLPHAEETRQQFRKETSKGCGPRPEVVEHEQDTAVQVLVERDESNYRLAPHIREKLG